VITGGQLLGFSAAALVMIVIPGPGVLFVVGRALSHGRRTALATAAGHAAGNYVVAAFVAVGLGEILQRSALAFVVVKLAGALYLAWLGIQAIRHRKSLADAFAAVAEPRDGWRALRDGVVHLVRRYLAAVREPGRRRGSGADAAAGPGGGAHGRGFGLRLGVRGERGAELVHQLATAVRAGRRGGRPGHDRRGRDGGDHRPQRLSPALSGCGA
jgi:hypothetical protein